MNKAITLRKIALVATAAADHAIEWLIELASSPLAQQYSFHILAGASQCQRLMEKGLVAVAVETGPAVRDALKQLAPDLIQSFSEQDHRQAVRFVLSHPTTLLATHLRVEEAIAAGRINHFVYNRLTDLNLFIDAAAKARSGSSGCLGLQNPVILHQDSLGGDVWQMLGHVYGSLLHPERLDVHHNIKRDFSDIKLAYITHFYCNQQDITSVTRLLERYAAYPPEVRAQVQFVIVDDGSPIKYQIPELPLNLTWIRIDQDIRWNQAGARNLGVVYARADTILMTDLDHELPLASMQQLLRRGSCGKRLYKMRRRDAEGRTYKGHSNFFVMSRGRFFECHGYDEEFAGHYGAEDFRFVKYQKARGSFQTYLPARIYCIERTDIDRQRSYHSLVRDLSFNSAADSRKRRELAQVGHGYGHSRMFLNFTWTILSDQRFVHAVARPKSRWWKYRSLLRQVMPRF